MSTVHCSILVKGCGTYGIHMAWHTYGIHVEGDTWHGIHMEYLWAYGIHIEYAWHSHDMYMEYT